MKEKPIVIAPVYREMIEAITKAACQHFDVTKDQLLNEYSLSNVRQLCYYIIDSSIENISHKAIGYFFNRKRTAVAYGLDLVDTHKHVYRQTLGSMNEIITIANTFEKKYKWHLQPISIRPSVTPSPREQER